MTAIRIIDDHVQLASIGSKTHAAIEGHIQGIGNYAFPAADGGADQVLKTNGAGVLAWIDKNHSIASHNDTTATGAELETLTDNSIADALHRHSELVASDGSPDPALKVDANGKVGIGTPIPNYLLHLINTVQDILGIEVNSDTDYQDPMISFLRSRGNVGAKSIVSDGDELGSIRFRGYDGSGWEDAAKIICYVDGVPSDGTDMPGRLSFETTPNGTDQCVARLTIKNNGHIGIGTTTPATSALLELSSTTGALLLTRMTTTQRNALTAVNGMLLYNSTLNKFQGYENGAWTSLI